MPVIKRILPPTGSLPDFCKQPEDFCPVQSDGQHCRHWDDGEACCGCGAPAMTEDEKIEQGMVEGPARDAR